MRTRSGTQSRLRPTSFRPTAAGIWIIALVLAFPIFVVVSALFAPAPEVWSHLRSTVLTSYVINTAALSLMVGAFALILGVGTAWLSVAYEFPGRRVFGWALVLPLACPAYIIAYVYTDLLEFSGPVQAGLRALFGWNANEYWFPNIRSLYGAALVLGLVLYPYVYLAARASFLRQSTTLFEAARVLGAGPYTAFVRVALPTARPAIAGGLALVLMETVADYGVVEYFSIPTFTTGIFRTWFEMGERLAALQLAGWLFMVVAAIVLFEAISRRGQTSNPVSRDRAMEPVRLSAGRGLLAALVCLAPIALGFLVPMISLANYAFTEGDPLLGRSFFEFARNSFFVAGAAALVATCLAMTLAHGARVQQNFTSRAGIRLATLGYAMPGTVLALGVLVPLTQADRAIAGFFASHTDWSVGLLMTGTTAALIYAYVSRFLTAAFNVYDGSLQRIHKNIDGAARMLGASGLKQFSTIHLPLLRGAILSAALLVFIDVMKELPATLLLRPFNFETLATRVYRLASDEKLAEASTAALTIVILGMIPVILLTRSIERSRTTETSTNP